MWFLSNFFCCIFLTTAWITHVVYSHEIDTTHAKTIISSQRNLRVNRESEQIDKSSQELSPENRPQHRETIVGGEATVEERYPYVVTLKKKNGKHKCGGTLIAPNMVLTAAHCRNIKTVVIGDHNMIDEAGNEEIFKVISRIRHPDYNRWSYEYDAMILVLNDKSTHPPVRLNTDNDFPSVFGRTTVIGWGSTDENGKERPEEMQEVSLSVVGNTECNNQHKISITNSMICTTDTDGAFDSDACVGDSGGPLIFKGENATEDIQVGIVSFGSMPCASPNIPGGYTRVSAIHEWIHDIMCDGPFACRTFEAPLQLTLTINFDRYPNEIGWDFRGKPYNEDTWISVDNKKFESYSKKKFALETETTVLDIAEEGSYVFSIRDKLHDGLCCNYGNGNYTLSLCSLDNPNDLIVSYTTQDLRSLDIYQIEVTNS